MANLEFLSNYDAQLVSISSLHEFHFKLLKETSSIKEGWWALLRAHGKLGKMQENLKMYQPLKE
jgi:hypothetical protein